MWIQIDGQKLQVIRLESSEELNKTYEINVIALSDPNREFIPKLPTSAKLSYCDLRNTRNFEGLVTEARQSGLQQVESNAGKNMMYVWHFTIRPALYALFNDRSSEVYEGTAKVVIQALLSPFKVAYTYKGDRPKRTFVRYDQLGLDFWDQLISAWNLQYFFYNGALHITDDLSRPPETYSIPEIAILHYGVKYASSPGVVEAVTYEPEKSAKPQLMKHKISSASGKYQVNARSAEHDVLNLAEQLTRHPEYEFTLDSQTHLNVGCKIKFKNSKVYKEYSVVRLKHTIRPIGGRWLCRTDVSCTLATKLPLFCMPQMFCGAHEAVVVGGEHGTVVVDKNSMIKIRYAWQSSEVAIPATVGLLACGASSRGTWAPPHVGDRVVVVGMHGDLLRPVVRDSLADVHNKPPILGNEQLTQQILRTAPLGKTPPTELKIENKPGKETVALQAPGNLDVCVLKDRIERVDGESRYKLKLSRTTTIQEGGCKTELLGKSAHHELHIKDGESTCKIDRGAYNLVLGGGDQNINVTGKCKHRSSSEYTIEAQTIRLKCGGCTIEINGNRVSVDAGAGTVSLQGSKIELSGKSEVELRAPNIKFIGMASVDIKAPKFAVSAQAQVDIKAGMNAVLSGGIGVAVKGGANATLSSTGMTSVQGGVVKLN
jgi:hypothetical protein